MVEALDPFFMAITSSLFISKVFHNLHMLWMYIWMHPYHVTTSLINQALRILLRILDKNAGEQTTALCCGWVSGLNKKNTYQFETYLKWLTWMHPYHVTRVPLSLTKLLRFTENLGKCWATNHSIMRWLRLWTH